MERRFGEQAREGLAGERGRGRADQSQSMILQYLPSVNQYLWGTTFETGTRRQESGTQDPGSQTEPGAPSASQGSHGNCSSDVLCAPPKSRNSAALITGRPPVIQSARWFQEPPQYVRYLIVGVTARCVVFIEGRLITVDGLNCYGRGTARKIAFQIALICGC